LSKSAFKDKISNFKPREGINMHKEIQAILLEEKPQGTVLRVLVPSRLDDIDLDRFAGDGIIKGEIRIDDGRRISSDQRRKTYATLKDISIYSGHEPEEIKEIMKYDYIAETGADYFSLSDCSVITARLFINHLIEFAFKHNIPLMDLVLNRTDDISATIYASIIHKCCIICGGKGELHHVDAVGMGRKRKEIIHQGMEVLCLCRKHHTEAHAIGHGSFNEKYVVYGLEADERICKVWNLKAQTVGDKNA